MKITKQNLRNLIREQTTKYSWYSPEELEEYGLEPGSREILTKDINWVNRGGLQNPYEQRTAYVLAGADVEVGRLSDDGSKIEVYDLGQDALFTVRTADLIKATE
jgi:hypothetical protein